MVEGLYWFYFLSDFVCYLFCIHVLIITIFIV